MKPLSQPSPPAANVSRRGFSLARPCNQANQLPYGLVLVAQFSWLNGVLFLLNVLILGFPLDGGQMEVFGGDRAFGKEKRSFVTKIR